MSEEKCERGGHVPDLCVCGVQHLKELLLRCHTSLVLALMVHHHEWKGSERGWEEVGKVIASVAAELELAKYYEAKNPGAPPMIYGIPAGEEPTE